MTQLWAIIREELPGAEEKIGYGMPTFKYNGKNAVHFAGYAKHIGIYPGAEPVEFFAEELAGYKVTRGGIQLPHNKELPTDLIRQVVAHLAASMAVD